MSNVIRYLKPRINFTPTSFHSDNGYCSPRRTRCCNSMQYPYKTGIPIRKNERTTNIAPIRNLKNQFGSLNGNVNASPKLFIVLSLIKNDYSLPKGRKYSHGGQIVGSASVLNR